MNQIKLDLPLAQPAALEGPTGRPYYEIVRDELARNIATGKLWPGVVLLEGPIVCGVGACGVCTIALRKGPRTLCHDGPVFDLRDVI